jgi:hypothetical protein
MKARLHRRVIDDRDPSQVRGRQPNGSCKVNAFRKFGAVRKKARKQAAAANLGSAATPATDGKARAQGRVRRRSRTGACCLQIPEPRFPAASTGSRSGLFSGHILTIEFPKGITCKVRLTPDPTYGLKKVLTHDPARARTDA